MPRRLGDVCPSPRPPSFPIILWDRRPCITITFTMSISCVRYSNENIQKITFEHLDSGRYCILAHHAKDEISAACHSRKVRQPWTMVFETKVRSDLMHGFTDVPVSSFFARLPLTEVHVATIWSWLNHTAILTQDCTFFLTCCEPLKHRQIFIVTVKSQSEFQGHLDSLHF